MTDNQKGACFLLLAFFLALAAVGFQTSSPSGFAGGLCYLGTYIAGIAGLAYLARGFFGGHDAAEEQQLGK